MSKVSYTKYHRDEDYRKFEGQFRNIFQTRFNIANRFVKSGRVLDIGASTGTMLDIFAENGWETWGVDPSGSSEIASKKGHKIIRGYFEKVRISESFFDLVIMNHTLEHMEDPLIVVKRVNKILKKRGILLIDVPNLGGLGSKVLGKYWPYLLPEEHRHQFTKEILGKLLKEAGFKIIHTESRSGIFEYADPVLELWDSLVSLKKRFFFDLLTLPYALCATLLNMGDSMSFIARKY